MWLFGMAAVPYGLWERRGILSHHYEVLDEYVRVWEAVLGDQGSEGIALSPPG